MYITIKGANVNNKANLARVFKTAMFDTSDLYQDFAYLSYSKDDDIAGAHRIIFDDLDRIRVQVDNLYQVASNANIVLDITETAEAIQYIKENLLQINSLDDIDKHVLYRDGELFQNDLIDIWAGKLQNALHGLYYQLCKYLDNQTLYPFWNKFPDTLTYYRVLENPQSAIQQAFTYFEDYLRKQIGVGNDLFGEELINRAFGKNGKLTYSTIPAEQNGARNLLSGAYATFRNPNMHRITGNNEITVLAILSLIYTMFDIVEKSEMNTDDRQ